MTNVMELMISKEAIEKKIASFALQLDQKYQQEEVILIMILKGSICFVADLIRQIHFPCILETIRCQSYGYRGAKRGNLVIEGLEKIEISGKHLLVVDDIFDSGITLSTIVDVLEKKHPKTITTAVLLEKPAGKLVEYKPDYSLFLIEDEFVIGYGLDYNEHYRGLSGIYKFVTSVKE